MKEAKTTEDLLAIAKEAMDELGIVDEDKRQDVYLYTITNRSSLNANTIKGEIKNIIFKRKRKNKSEIISFDDRMKMYEDLAKVLFYDLDDIHRDAVLLYYELDPSVTYESTGMNPTSAQQTALEAVEIMKNMLIK